MININYQLTNNLANFDANVNSFFNSSDRAYTPENEETSYLQRLKRLYEETTGCFAERKKEQEREVAIAREEYLKQARTLTDVLNYPGIKEQFYNDRILCDGLTGNPNMGKLLRIVVFRHLTNEEKDIFLKYHPDLGFVLWHSAKDFAAKTNINIHTIYKLIPKLREENWFEIFYKQDVFGRVKWHFKLNIETFIERVLTYTQTRLVDSTNFDTSTLPTYTYIKINNKKNNIEAENKFLYKDNTNSQECDRKPDSDGKIDETITSQPDPWEPELDVNSNKSPDSGTELLPSLSQQTYIQKEVPRVDEKINKVSNKRNAQKSTRETEKPILRGERRMHRPEGDRYFNNGDYSSIRREMAKSQSVVGMSGFKDVAQMEECSDCLTEYYLEIHDFETASKKVGFEIKEAVLGRRSQLIKEFLEGLPLGEKYKQEWEYKRGLILPVFDAYLASKLRRNGDTPEQVRNKIFWFKKDIANVKAAWAECKRIIHVQKPKLLQAVQLGRDLYALDIPIWFIDTFRRELEVDEILDTAKLLGEIAITQAEQTEKHQERLTAKQEEIPELPPLHPIRSYLSQNILADTFCPSEEQRREKIDSVMDKLTEANQEFDDLESKRVSGLRDLDSDLSQAQKIDKLLQDPILRQKGKQEAKKAGLPLLFDECGEAIAIDKTTLKDDICDPIKNLQTTVPYNDPNFFADGHNAAHLPFEPQPKVTKLSEIPENVWETAIANSKFLSNARAKNRQKTAIAEGKKREKPLPRSPRLRLLSKKRSIRPTEAEYSDDW